VIDVNVGNRIKEARKAQGLTQDALALKLGVKRAVVSKYEAGTVSLSLEQLEKIAKALDTAITFLIDGNSEMTSEEIDELGADIVAEQDRAHLEEYQLLDNHGRDIVNAVTRIEASRVRFERQSNAATR
jgi:transcriptional regulator with XRE-family HTH domain